MPDESSHARLCTVHVIPLTPFTADGERIDQDVYHQHLQQMVGAGVSMVVCGAGTGEFHALEPAELGELVTAARAAASGRALVYGAIGLGLRHALACGEAVRSAGADGLLIMPPTGPYLSDAGLADYYRVLLDRLDAPTAIYRRSPLPGNELLLDLCADPRVVAVKEANDDVLGLARLTAECAQVAWICGSAERWAPFYALSGAVGFTSGVANLVPRLTLKLHAALVAGEFQEAMRLRRFFCDMEDFRARGATSYNVVALKRAMAARGLAFGPARAPMRALTEPERREVDGITAALLAAEEQECA